jgi:tripeptidyl-peptidase I
MKIAQQLLLLGLAAFEATANPLHQYALPSTTLQLSKRTVPHTHVQHEKRTAVQEGAWSKVERAKREALLPMRIGLKQLNLMDGHNLLMDM